MSKTTPKYPAFRGPDWPANLSRLVICDSCGFSAWTCPGYKRLSYHVCSTGENKGREVVLREATMDEYEEVSRNEEALE